MTNLARFTISGSPSVNRRFDVTVGQTPVLQLEQSSSLVWRVTYEVHSTAPDSPRATHYAPTLTLDNGSGGSGQTVDATTPSSSVTVSDGIPGSATAHLWEIRCFVNGGINTDGTPNPDWIFSRYMAMRSPQGLRKILGSERDEYDPIDSWAGAINELIDLWITSTGSVDPTKLPLSSLGIGTKTLSAGSGHVTAALPSSYRVYLTPTSQGDYPGIVTPANQTTAGFDLLSDNSFDNGTYNYLWITL